MIDIEIKSVRIVGEINKLPDVIVTFKDGKELKIDGRQFWSPYLIFQLRDVYEQV